MSTQGSGGSTLIFDIGKTNQKVYVFDQDYREIHREQTSIPEIKDDDGFPSEDLLSIWIWMDQTAKALIREGNYGIEYLNITTHGAAVVFLDEEKKLATPFYNYLKSFPDKVKNIFLSDIGIDNFELQTSSPFMGFLNSGLQLPYLKYAKPHLFKTIKTCLHFPQYLSYLFTGHLVSESTSIGCHTGLWNFSKARYADWIWEMDFEDYLPEVVPGNTTFRKTIHNKELNVGIGIHDSSSALIPYLKTNTEPFLVLSTGTWIITLNPFNKASLTLDELNKDCLNFLDPNKQQVRASRLFMGRHLDECLKAISEFFDVEENKLREAHWNGQTLEGPYRFNHDLIKASRFGFDYPTDHKLESFANYTQAVLSLIWELTDILVSSIKLALGKENIKRIYVEGGFTQSQPFLKMLAAKLPKHEIYTTEYGSGTALGAAMVLHDNQLNEEFLKTNYKVSRIS